VANKFWPSRTSRSNFTPPSLIYFRISHLYSPRLSLQVSTSPYLAAEPTVRFIDLQPFRDREFCPFSLMESTISSKVILSSTGKHLARSHLKLDLALQWAISSLTHYSSHTWSAFLAIEMAKCEVQVADRTGTGTAAVGIGASRLPRCARTKPRRTRRTVMTTIRRARL